MSTDKVAQDAGQHTPGPWYIYPGTHKYPGIEAPGGKTIVIFGEENSEAGVRCNFNGDRETILANARLISAAPDLLEACKSIASEYSYSNRRVSEESIELIYAAIKKATNS